jgi:hypothetical protein
MMLQAGKMASAASSIVGHGAVGLFLHRIESVTIHFTGAVKRICSTGKRSGCDCPR